MADDLVALLISLLISLQLPLILLVCYLARKKKTCFAWTGATLLFTPYLTLIVFLILEARNRKRQDKLGRVDNL